MKTAEKTTPSSNNLHHPMKGAGHVVHPGEIGRDGTFFSNGYPEKLSFFQPHIAQLVQTARITGQAQTQPPQIQRSPLSEKVDALWNASPSKEAVFNFLAQDDAFANRADTDLEKSLSAIFTDTNDLWLAQKILHRQLGESEGKFRGASIKLPIELFFIKGSSSNDKALVIAGVHGSERQGIETANLLKADLARKQPYYNVILVPSLFPVNAKNKVREGTNETNRNFPEKGTTLSQAKKDTQGVPLDADGDKILIENQLLIQLIERFKPSRIISIHGTQYAHQAGVFSDPITQKPDYSKLYKEAADLAAYMLSDSFYGDFQYPNQPYYSGGTQNTSQGKLQDLTQLMYSYMIQEKERLQHAQTDQDKALSIKTAQAITKNTDSIAGLKNRYTSSQILKKVEDKFPKGSDAYNAAVKSLKMNPAVAGNKLDQDQKSEEWAGGTSGGVSLGGFAPSHGISVFTVEPAINKTSSEYPQNAVDSNISEVERLAELQAYADAIRTVLLGK